MTTKNILWQTKVAAWVHDPAEKALVLLRDPAGHEGGTVARLKEQLFPAGLPTEVQKFIKKADHWAAAADRPQFPREKDGGRFQPWAQVRFAETPELVHPLSGERITIRQGFCDLDPAHLKAVSVDHFESLIVKSNGDIDWQATALAFWRFGPECPARDLNLLWSLLPADTRVTDHTIWAHLDLTSALAGAFAADPSATPALLAMSLGPVQDFIAQARTTSDLWAGSHLLSRLAWEGMRAICEEMGPDSILFPQLRNVSLVDLWLQQEMGLPEELFKELEWRRRGTDANPLFCAALPNRFLALVPADTAKDLAETAKERVRAWVQDEARATMEELLRVGGISYQEELPCFTQMKRQLKDFPEVYWAAVPWSLVKERDRSVPDATELAAAMAPFFPEKGNERPGFLGSKTWQVLSGNIDFDGVSFYRPNPGVLYPALYDLLDRVAAAAKSVRPFSQTSEDGYRCSLCGEREWLTTDRKQLHLPPGQREGTLWTRISAEKPSWAREGEHLCGLCAMKRLWPSRFVEGLRQAVDIGEVRRYVVSTHTMALATSLGQWLDDPKPLPSWLSAQLQVCQDQAALPKSLADRLHNANEDTNLLCRRLPVLLDMLREAAKNEGDHEQIREIEQKIKEEVFGHKPEAYYGLIMMDGDKMGAWLSGSEERFCLPFGENWHSQVKAKAFEIARGNEALRQYLATSRPPSPARHMAISGALNSFSLELARHVIEDLYKGKLLYSGGDDLLAMVSVDDLLPAMLLLRLVYSGIFPGGDDDTDAWREVLGQQKKMLDIGRGHVQYKGRLYRMMGRKATASAGAIITHHTAPLGMVLRTLRETENRAKDEGKRDAFSVTLLKRSGGAVNLTCPWLVKEAESLAESSMGLLIRLRNAFAGPGLSRRAAYLIQEWATQLPGENAMTDPDQHEKMLAAALAYQFRRQSKDEPAQEDNACLGRELACLARRSQRRAGRDNPAAFITDFLAVAEFLAREGRSGTKEEQGGSR